MASYDKFYNAIGSGDVKNLCEVIADWRHSHSAIYHEELDAILSRAYDELRLKNVKLSDEMEVFVEHELLRLRFFTYSSDQNGNRNINLDSVKERIDLVIQNIELLKAEYSDTEKIDDHFVFLLKFIAQNIHTLKQQLKSTYDRLPWEELEFCLVSYISSLIKKSEMDIFYNFVLNKNKIIKFLDSFAEKLKEDRNLENVKDINELANLPKLSRDEVVADIIRLSPEFDELYEYHKQIRDLHSITKMHDYTKLAIGANPATRDGELTLIRILQVIGEYVKNDLESPKLSSHVAEFLLLTFSKDIRKIILDLRNSSSNAHSLCKRIEIEENAVDNFFTVVHNNIIAIHDVLTYILYRSNVYIVRMLAEDILHSDSFDEIVNIVKPFMGTDTEYLTNFKYPKINQCEKIHKLMRELSDNITDKTPDEEKEFQRIITSMEDLKNHPNELKDNNVLMGKSLRHVKSFVYNNKLDKDLSMSAVKGIAKQSCEYFSPWMGSDCLTKMVELITEIFHRDLPRIQTKNLNEVKRLSFELLCFMEMETGNRKRMDELFKTGFISTYTQWKGFDVTNEEYNDLLTEKISELHNILSSNGLIGNDIVEFLPIYKSDKALQAVIEILVLDIMSILDTHKNQLTNNNALFLDDYAPLLTGKCLLNYLAHGDSLIDLFLPNLSIEIFLNAERLISTNVTKSRTKIGKLIPDNPSKLKNKYKEYHAIITDQMKMFAALERGNFEEVKCYLKNGADIKARSIDTTTTLHFAVKGSSIDALKFVLNKTIDVNVKDVNGRSPLHVAAAHGRTNIVEYLVRETNVLINDIDSIHETPLHIAAVNNHKDIVKILLTRDPDRTVIAGTGYTPFIYALICNYVDIFKILVEKEVNVDVKSVVSGGTPLHYSAITGHLELVNYLLKNKANVNAINFCGSSPLNYAIRKGHHDVVDVLLLNGAEVNARSNTDYPPLHAAVEFRQDHLIDVLLNHGADVNAVTEIKYETPLHIAAERGYTKIVEALLKNNADTSAVSIAGYTPLHLAAQNGHVDIVAILHEYELDLSAKRECTYTPLRLAVKSGHKEVTEYLIKCGADINDKDDKGGTPLHVAIMGGYTDIAVHLIKNNADIHAQDDWGHTPLHKAAMKNRVDIIDLLIQNNAEINCETKLGNTPLSLSARRGHDEATALLIERKAKVNSASDCGVTPLHHAIESDNVNIVKLLLENKAFVNAVDITGNTPLHFAIKRGNKEIMEILIANGADVNINICNTTPLICAIRYNRKEIVEVLINNGADFDERCRKLVLWAVRGGYHEIAEVLLNNTTCIDIESPENGTLLHLATERGHKDIVNILISKGYNVDAQTSNGATPLCIAAEQGYDDIAEVLIANGANVDVQSDEGTPLHIAVKLNNANVVRVLLSNKADINIKGDNNEKRTPLELAVEVGNLQIVRMIMQNRVVNVNAIGRNKWTLLHMAAFKDNVKMLKYLIRNGYDINASDAYHLKPVYNAVISGSIENVKFFLGKGISINEFNVKGQTLLHIAAIGGRSEMVRYLIAEGADVNSKDTDGLTAMHNAAHSCYKDVVEALLSNNAIVNPVNKGNKTPLEISKCSEISNIISITEKLFQSVKRNRPVDVKKDIEAGAFVNAKNIKDLTPLHYAAWKGYKSIVEILLENKANPNVVDINGFTSLHYAAKFSHENIVKSLLFHGAVYDAVSNSGKTPLDLTTNKDITILLQLISDLFKQVSEGKATVIVELNKIKDTDKLKAVMRARNRKNEVLMTFAAHNKFPALLPLFMMIPKKSAVLITTAEKHQARGQYTKALTAYKSLFEKKKDILGLDNPATKQIQQSIAYILNQQGEFKEALALSEETYRDLKRILGVNSMYTLRTQLNIGLLLVQEGLHKMACNTFRETYHKLRNIMGEHDEETLSSKHGWAVALLGLGKSEEATKLLKPVYDKLKETRGKNNAITLDVQFNLATSLYDRKKYSEALHQYMEISKIYTSLFSIKDAGTMKALSKVAETLVKLNKYKQALKINRSILDAQNQMFEMTDLKIFYTQHTLADILYCQGKYISALKYYRDNVERWGSHFKSSDTLSNILNKIELINSRFMYESIEESEYRQLLDKDINIAARDGNAQQVLLLLKYGVDANDEGSDRQTPLQHAVNNGHLDIVNILIENGANITPVNNQGATLLHIATSNGHEDIIQVLLQHCKREMNDTNVFINTKFNGSTSLHIAAECGFFKIVLTLLKYGANYEIRNNKDQKAVELAKNKKITDLLQLIDKLFNDIEHIDFGAISELQSISPDELSAIGHARNDKKNTLLQHAASNGCIDNTRELLKMLKTVPRQD